MTDLVLEYSQEKAEKLVIKAFKNTKGISKVKGNKFQIVGKTGISLTSYGETVTVDISELEGDKTSISVNADKKVPFNITANPDKYKRRFLQALDNLR